MCVICVVCVSGACLCPCLRNCTKLVFLDCARESSILSAEKSTFFGSNNKSNFFPMHIICFRTVSLTEINGCFCKIERYIGT